MKLPELNHRKQKNEIYSDAVLDLLHPSQILQLMFSLGG